MAQETANRGQISASCGSAFASGRGTMAATPLHPQCMSPKKLMIVERSRQELARGPMTAQEQADFDLARAYEMHRAELRRHPEQAAPELPLRRAA